MKEEIALQKVPVVMKGGLCHWVSPETCSRIQQALQSQTAHSFMRISELGITVNTAEVEGVYTPEQYAEMCRIKQGEWRCQSGRWHKKKEVCDCELEAARMRREATKEAEFRLSNVELSLEERARVDRKREEVRASLKAADIIK